MSGFGDLVLAWKKDSDELLAVVESKKKLTKDPSVYMGCGQHVQQDGWRRMWKESMRVVRYTMISDIHKDVLTSHGWGVIMVH